MNIKVDRIRKMKDGICFRSAIRRSQVNYALNIVCSSQKGKMPLGNSVCCRDMNPKKKEKKRIGLPVSGNCRKRKGMSCHETQVILFEAVMAVWDYD